MPINVDADKNKKEYTIPFYLKINGEILPVSYMQKVNPTDRESVLVDAHENDARIRLNETPSVNKPAMLEIAPNMYDMVAESRDKGTWKTDKIDVEVILPKGLEFKKTGNVNNYNNLLDDNYELQKMKLLKNLLMK